MSKIDFVKFGDIIVLKNNNRYTLRKTKYGPRLLRYEGYIDFCHYDSDLKYKIPDKILTDSALAFYKGLDIAKIYRPPEIFVATNCNIFNGLSNDSYFSLLPICHIIDINEGFINLEEYV